MNEPRLILIADRFTNNSVSRRIIQAVEGGIRWVHLRDHEAEEAKFLEAAKQVSIDLRALDPAIRITVNRRLSIANILGCDFHTSSLGASIKEARRVLPAHATVGFSAHNSIECNNAVQRGADYLFLSPIFPTTSKLGHAGIGLRVLNEIVRQVSKPVYALGGITPDRVHEVLAAGAYGVAVLSGILHHRYPQDATKDYIEAITERRGLIRS